MKTRFKLLAVVAIVLAAAAAVGAGAKKDALYAIAAQVRFFIDAEVPTVTQWNVNPNKLKSGLESVGDFFDQVDADHAALVAKFNADHDPVTGKNPVPSEWVTDAAAPTFLSSSQFRFSGNRTADYKVAHRIQATLGSTTVVLAITSSSYDGSNTTLTVTPASLTSSLNKIERGLVRVSVPKIQESDLVFELPSQADIDAKVAKAGDTMTGPLVLSADPASGLQAATKQYADGKVARSGDTLTGPLVLAADPAAAMQASTRQYTDGKVAKVGDTMTGPLVLSADPTTALQAAPKQYVDARVARSGDTMTGPFNLAGDPSAALQAATKQYVDKLVTPVFTNKTGDTLSAGDVVALDEGNDSSVRNIGIDGYPGPGVVIAAETIANNASGHFVLFGATTAKASGVINRGNYVRKSIINKAVAAELGSSYDSANFPSETSIGFALANASGGQVPIFFFGAESRIPRKKVTTSCISTGANTTETDLCSLTIPAGLMTAESDRSVRIWARGTTAATTNTKRMRLYFKGTIVGNTTPNFIALNGGSWEISAIVSRNGLSTSSEIWSGHFATSDTTIYPYTARSGTASELLTPNDATVKVTGTNNVAAGGDIVGTQLGWELL